MQKNREPIRVGPGGQYSSLSEVLASLASHSDKAETIRLLSGFVLDEQLIFEGRHLGSVTIESEDAIVPIHRSSLRKGIEVAPFIKKRYPAFAGLSGSVLPVMNCRFLMDRTGDWERRDGVVLAGASRAHFLHGAGISGTDWSRDRREDVGAGIGAFVLTGSLLLADGAVFDDCARAIYARFGSQVNFRRGLARRCGWTAIQLQEAYMSCEEAILTDAGHYGLRARKASYCNAHGVDVSGANGHGVNSNEGSKINFRDGVARDCGMNARENYFDPPEASMHATECSTISAMNAIVTGAATNALFARSGGFIDFRNGQASTMNGHPALRVEMGAFISAHGSSGTLSQNANIVTSAGIIFDGSKGSPHGSSLNHQGEFELGPGEEVRLTTPNRGGKLTLVAGSDTRYPNLACSGEFFFDTGDSPDVLLGPCGKKFTALVEEDDKQLEGAAGKCTVVVESGAIRIINKATPAGKSIRYRYQIT